MQQVEKFTASSVEYLLSFKKFCRVHDIRQILFDGDDTIWATVPTFRQKIDANCHYLSQAYGHDFAYWREQINTINNSLFEAHAVNPRRWNLVVSQLTALHRLSPEDSQILRKNFRQIYQTPLPFLPGAAKALDFLKSDPELPPLGIVTHANRDWTWKKYNWLSLGHFLPWDDIFIVDENHHKTKESWAQALTYFKVRPRNCLVCGDSPRTDINPVNDLGVAFSFLVRNQTPLWTIHNLPFDTDKTKIIDSLADLRFLGKKFIFSQG